MKLDLPVAHADPLHAQVYERIWNSLAAGELPAGERLKDTEWAARLGVSRTPVREALRKLAHDGALDALGPGGYRVHLFSPAEVDDLYRCRAALEALVAEEAAGRRDPALLKQLAENLKAAEQALARDDLEALQPVNGAFHDALIDATRNAHLRRLLDQTRRVVQMARRQVLARAAQDPAPRGDYRRSMEAVVADHRALYEALAAGDAARAGSFMRRHLLATAKDMMALLRAASTADNG